jgi:hypothetical protein
LVDALVRTGFVEVAAVFFEDPVQVLFTEHEDMIQALPPDAAEKALAHGVRARRSDRGLEHFRAP